MGSTDNDRLFIQMTKKLRLQLSFHRSTGQAQEKEMNSFWGSQAPLTDIRLSNAEGHF